MSETHAYNTYKKWKKLVRRSIRSRRIIGFGQYSSIFLIDIFQILISIGWRFLFIRYRDETISKRFSLFLFFFFKKNRWTILIASILRNQNSLPEEPSSFHDYRTIWKKIGEILEIAKSHAPLLYSILFFLGRTEKKKTRRERIVSLIRREGIFKFRNARERKQLDSTTFNDCRRRKGATKAGEVRSLAYL